MVIEWAGKSWVKVEDRRHRELTLLHVDVPGRLERVGRRDVGPVDLPDLDRGSQRRAAEVAGWRRGRGRGRG